MHADEKSEVKKREIVKLDFEFDSTYDMHEIPCQNESGWAISSHEITHLDGIITIYLDAIMTCFVSNIGKYPIIILSKCRYIFGTNYCFLFFSRLKRYIIFQNDSLFFDALFFDASFTWKKNDFFSQHKDIKSV